MALVIITRDNFLEDPQGRKFSDVLYDPDLSFGLVLEFFNDSNRQRRMEESEIHHDRPPLSGVVREFEAHPDINQSLAVNTRQSNRLRQAVGVLVRMIMQRLGWHKTGKKGSLGVRRASKNKTTFKHNTGGLSFWFIRAERYKLLEGMPFKSVQDRSQDMEITIKS